jgi:hypothetical protein
MTADGITQGNSTSSIAKLLDFEASVSPVSVSRAKDEAQLLDKLQELVAILFHCDHRAQFANSVAIGIVYHHA